MQVCCAMANPSASGLERVKRIGRYLVENLRAECFFHEQQSGEIEAYSDADWGGDKVAWRSVSAGVIMRGGHCESMDQAAVGGVFVHCRMRTARRSQNRVRGMGKTERGEGPGHCMWVEPTRGCPSDDLLGQPQKVGRWLRTYPADLKTKQLPGPKIVQLMKIMGCDFVGQHLEREGLHCTKLVRSQRCAELFLSVVYRVAAIFVPFACWAPCFPGFYAFFMYKNVVCLRNCCAEKGNSKKNKFFHVCFGPLLM